MGFNRIEAKMLARNSMRQTKPNPMLVTLVYVLMTTGVTSLIMHFVGDPMSEVLDYLQMGYDQEQVFEYVFAQNPARTSVYSALNWVLSLYMGIASFGYASYALRMARNEQPDYRNLLDGFAKLGKVLWMRLLIGIFTTLWVIAASVPIGLVVLLFESVAGLNYAVMALVVLATVGYMAIILAITYRYRLADYFLLDDPSCTAREAIRRSVAAMRGWKMELFMLDLSFLGWSLLALFVPYGLFNVWLLPYRTATVANFYDSITASTRQSGGYAGPEYDYKFTDGPQPF